MSELPEWVEKKLESMQKPLACAPADYEEGCRDGYNEAIDDVRAFLAQYVLCEKGPAGYLCMGDPDSYSAFHWNQQHCKVCNAPRTPVYSALEEGK